MFQLVLATAIMLFSLSCTVMGINPNGATASLVFRQTSPSTDPQCLNYARTANLSTIASNSTYRSAFLQASPVGTMYNTQILNTAIKDVATLIGDQALNQACGNLTVVALTEAERNFTMGIVAQFSDVAANPQQISAGIIVLFVSIGSMSFFFLLSIFVL